MTTFLGAPVLVRGEAWGNIYLDREGQRQFDEADEQASCSCSLAGSRSRSRTRTSTRKWTHAGATRARRERRSRRQSRSRARSAARSISTGCSSWWSSAAGRWWTRACCWSSCGAGRAGVAAAAGEAGAGAIGLPSAPLGTRSARSCAPVTTERLSGPVQPGTAWAGRARRQHPRSDAGPSHVPRPHARAAGRARPLESSARLHADDERVMRAFAGSAATALATAQNVEAEQLRLSIAAADQERRRWARELHDETLQGLGALQVILTAGASAGARAPGAAVEQAVR